jgi:hypothetical protein
VVQYKLFGLFIQAVVLCHTGFAGFERVVQPTQVFAKAFSGVASATFEHLWLNPASAASISSFQSAIFHSPSPFRMSQLAHSGVILGNSFDVGSISIGLNTVGFPLYRETNGSLTYALNMSDEFSAGVTLHAFHLFIQGYGSTTVLGIDAGGIVSITNALSIGFSLANVNGTDIGGGEEIPRIISGGVSYCPVPSVAVSLDIVKDIRYRETYRAGVAFSPVDPISLYAGVQGEPSRMFGGAGITISSITVNYAIGTHADLGVSHSVGISFRP